MVGSYFRWENTLYTLFFRFFRHETRTHFHKRYTLHDDWWDQVGAGNNCDHEPRSRTRRWCVFAVCFCVSFFENQDDRITHVILSLSLVFKPLRFFTDGSGRRRLAGISRSFWFGFLCFGFLFVVKLSHLQTHNLTHHQSRIPSARSGIWQADRTAESNHKSQQRSRDAVARQQKEDAALAVVLFSFT